MRVARFVASAIAACVIGAQLAAPASAAQVLRALNVVSVNSVADSSSTRSVTAACTSQRLVGGGFYVDGDTQGKVVIERAFPGGSYFSVRAREHPKGTPGIWWLRAYAVCADDQAGFEVVTANGDTAACPAGKRPTGGGAETIGGNGEVMINSMMPGPNAVTARAGADADGTTAAWSLRTYAVCGPGDLPGLQRINTLAVADSSNKFVQSVCPSSSRTLSVGWEIGSRLSGLATPEIAVPATPPWANAGHVFARELGTGTPESWSLETTLVCAFA